MYWKTGTTFYNLQETSYLENMLMRRHNVYTKKNDNYKKFIPTQAKLQLNKKTPTLKSCFPYFL